MEDFAEMGVHSVRLTTALVVQITGESERFDTATHASFFMSFPGSRGRIRGIAIDSPFWKSPAPGAGTHQKKFNFTIRLSAVTDGSNHPAFSRPTPQESLP